MLTPEILIAMVVTTDTLAVVALATLAVCLAQGTASCPAALKAALPALGLLLWAAAWIWLPPLAAWRLGPVTSGAPSAVPTLALIAAAAVALSTLALTGAGRAFFARADRRTLLALGSWRTVFGGGLLMIGLAGGLPPGFYRSAGLGDIVVGVVSTALLAKGCDVTNRQFIAWNLLGLADLLHVIALAAIYVAPFFVANPALPPLNLVPLLVVPAFIALHVGVLAHAWQTARGAAPPPDAPADIRKSSTKRLKEPPHAHSHYPRDSPPQRLWLSRHSSRTRRPPRLTSAQPRWPLVAVMRSDCAFSASHRPMRCGPACGATNRISRPAVAS